MDYHHHHHHHKPTNATLTQLVTDLETSIVISLEVQLVMIITAAISARFVLAAVIVGLFAPASFSGDTNPQRLDRENMP